MSAETGNIAIPDKPQDKLQPTSDTLNSGLSMWTMATGAEKTA